MEYDERYEVKDPDIQRLLQFLGSRLGEAMPEGWGFGLFIFSYGENGAMFYISSAEREGMLKTLKEFIDREEKKKNATNLDPTKS